MTTFIDADSGDSEIIAEARKIGLPVAYVQLNTLLPNGDNCAEVHFNRWGAVVTRRFKHDAGFALAKEIK